MRVAGTAILASCSAGWRRRARCRLSFPRWCRHDHVPFLLVYGVSYFFTEFGPNMTTFVIPSEVYPVTMRATGHGISAGIGKFGAFIGVFLFPVLETSLGLRGTLLLTAGVGAGLRADLGPARDVPDQPGRYSQRPPGLA
jgi:hypothetical protein